LSITRRAERGPDDGSGQHRTCSFLSIITAHEQGVAGRFLAVPSRYAYDLFLQAKERRHHIPGRRMRRIRTAAARRSATARHALPQ